MPAARPTRTPPSTTVLARRAVDWPAHHPREGTRMETTGQDLDPSPGNSTIRVATYNFQCLGRDPFTGAYTKLHLLRQIVEQIPDVDVLFLQEAYNADLDGYRLLFDVEELLSPFQLRGFLTPLPDATRLHTVVFLRWPRIRPMSHYTPHAPDAFHDKNGFVYARVPGTTSPLKLMSVHLPYWCGDSRLSYAKKLTRHGDSPLIAGGDFNCQQPDDPARGVIEFEPNWDKMPPHVRGHKTILTAGGRLVSDRRALAALCSVGFANLGTLARDTTVTVNYASDNGQGARIDHLVVSPALEHAYVPGSYRVWANPLGDEASDHRLVSACLDLSQLAQR